MDNIRDRHSKTNIFKILRLCFGYSLNEMAKFCNVSAIYLNQLELGVKKKPSDEIINKIATACGLKSDTIRFLYEDKSGESANFQRILLNSLESYALRKHNASDANETSTIDDDCTSS